MSLCDAVQRTLESRGSSRIECTLASFLTAVSLRPTNSLVHRHRSQRSREPNPGAYLGGVGIALDSSQEMCSIVHEMNRGETGI